MHRAVLVAVAAATLAACATEEHYNRILAGWVGRHVDDLMVRWGPPDRSAALSDGRKVIAYDRERTVTSGGHTRYERVVTEDGDDVIYVPVTTPVRTRVLSCETRFVIAQQGIIESWSHDGNNCVARPPA